MPPNGQSNSSVTLPPSYPHTLPLLFHCPLTRHPHGRLQGQIENEADQAQDEQAGEDVVGLEEFLGDGDAFAEAAVGGDEFRDDFFALVGWGGEVDAAAGEIFNKACR